jgi:HAD superfamily hydrolase (TIGR01509 family)
MKALLLGSIGVLAETSELQRQAYNDAFAAQGLDWRWNIATYCQHLTTAGGQRRLREWAGGHLSDRDIEQIHDNKQKFFAERLAGGISPRPGICEAIDMARSHGLQLGLITTTTPKTLAMMQDALAGAIDFTAFHLVTSKADVAQEKPHPEVYETALQKLGVPPREAIAFEDTRASQAAATGAGLTCHLFAGDYAVTTGASSRTENPAMTLAATLARSSLDIHHAAAE